MLLSVLLASFCLLISFCMYEVFFLTKLMKRLKWHRKYVIEFMSIKDANGVSVENYLVTGLFPKYTLILNSLFISVLAVQLLPVSILIKAITLVVGIGLGCWSRYYNKSFLSLLWNTVLLPAA